MRKRSRISARFVFGRFAQVETPFGLMVDGQDRKRSCAVCASARFGISS